MMSEQSVDEVQVESAEEAVLQVVLEDLKSKISAFLDDDHIKVATVIFSVDGEESPHVLRKGHFYDNAVLLNTALNAYRAKAVVDLGL